MPDLWYSSTIKSAKTLAESHTTSSKPTWKQMHFELTARKVIGWDGKGVVVLAAVIGICCAL